MDHKDRPGRVGLAPLSFGLVLLVLGVVFLRFFNFPFSVVLVVLGVVTIVYALVSGRDRRVITATVLVVSLFGLVWALTGRSSDSADSPPLDSVASDANEYVRALAEEDLAAYRDLVDLVVGVSVEDAFRVERGCVDWRSVNVAVIPNEISPVIAYVTFSDGTSSLTRDFEYVSGHWVPTADDSC